MKRRYRWIDPAGVAIVVLGWMGLAPAQPTRPVRQTRVPPGVKAHLDLEYAKVGSISLKLDLYVPEKAARPMPVIAYIHGGGWSGGSKNRCPAVVMCLKGYAAASIEYRLSGVATFPAQIHDCKGAIRWLRANAQKYNLDPNRVGVWGPSAGGHLVALLGTTGDSNALEGDVGGNLDQSSRVQAVCDFFGPTDLVSIVGGRGFERPNNVVARLLGGPVAQKKDLAVLASPLTHVTKDDAPFLIMHGDKDRLVPLSQSQSLHDALVRAGVESTFHVVKGRGHGFGGAEIMRMVADFFDKHLAAPKAASQPAKGG
ncbi:MAG TPA: alpha/beta hydrolase [Phycisphaerae bacterium]|nr:alpha/beta hydrolase [Phycisphaerae bacterium]